MAGSYRVRNSASIGKHAYAPATPPLAEGFSTTTTDAMGVIHRMMLDRSGRTYFGYDVLIDVLPEANTYKVTFKPLVMTSTLAQGWSMDRWSEWIPLSAPRFPPPQNVRSGEILELTLLTNSGTGQRIVDYISLQDPVQTVPHFPFQPPPARTGFLLCDGDSSRYHNERCRIENPRPSIERQRETGSLHKHAHRRGCRNLCLDICPEPREIHPVAFAARRLQQDGRSSRKQPDLHRRFG